MPRYWVIAPYFAEYPELWEEIWAYDLSHGVISIGWRALGEVENLSRDEIRTLHLAKWPDSTKAGASGAAGMLHRFYHEIKVGDVVVARRGTKTLAAVGTVAGAPHFDPDRLVSIFDHWNEGERAYPNHLPIQWHEKPRDVHYDEPVFGIQTLHEIPSDKFTLLTSGSSVSIDDGTGESDEDVYELADSPQTIVLERHLEDLIISNFQSVFGGQLEPFTTPDGVVGQQFDTGEIGRIDILARDIESRSLVVIELKKGRTADQVVGQILRYMGWVEENLCEAGQNVRGIIICRNADERLRYAVRPVPSIAVKIFEIDFRLCDAQLS